MLRPWTNWCLQILSWDINHKKNLISIFNVHILTSKIENPKEGGIMSLLFSSN
jgi:hypothetical protein